jgi:hypothetical protein
MRITDNSKLLSQFKKQIYMNFTNTNTNTNTNTKYIVQFYDFLYKHIQCAETYYNKLIKQNKINVNIINFDNTFIQNHKDLQFLLKGNYITNEIRNYIYEKLEYIVAFQFPIGNRIISVFFGLFIDEIANYREKSEKLILQYNDYLKSIIMWLYIVDKILPKNVYCSSKLNIFAFFTHFQKTISNQIFEILHEKHINTAVTTSCVKNGNILIYRQEEWFKVFIHETFHVFGLDFSQMNIEIIKTLLDKTFCINNFELYETYCEIFANIVNVGFVSYFNSNKEKPNYIKSCLKNLNYEKYFSLYQMVKTLNYLGLNYMSLFCNNDKINFGNQKQKNHTIQTYKKTINVFEYYIYKTILLWNINEFLLFTKHFNTNYFYFTKTTETIKNFGMFILESYNKNDLIKSINSMENTIKNTDTNKSKKISKDLQETMKMTIISLH